jgi:hypothetical protein
MKDESEAEVAKNNVKEDPDFDLHLILISTIPLDTLHIRIYLLIPTLEVLLSAFLWIFLLQ